MPHASRFYETSDFREVTTSPPLPAPVLPRTKNLIPRRGAPFFRVLCERAGTFYSAIDPDACGIILICNGHSWALTRTFPGSPQA